MPPPSLTDLFQNTTTYIIPGVTPEDAYRGPAMTEDESVALFNAENWAAFARTEPSLATKVRLKLNKGGRADDGD